MPDAAQTLSATNTHRHECERPASNIAASCAAVPVEARAAPEGCLLLGQGARKETACPMERSYDMIMSVIRKRDRSYDIRITENPDWTRVGKPLNLIARSDVSSRRAQDGRRVGVYTSRDKVSRAIGGLTRSRVQRRAFLLRQPLPGISWRVCLKAAIRWNGSSCASQRIALATC